jgi:hypothetical protein
VDIDPGLNQMWISRQRFQVAAHSAYFTIGETVGREDALFPDAGLPWQYTPPCVALDQWPVVRGDGPFTTVTHWEAGEWADDPDGGLYRNDKRTGFADFLDLPSLTSAPLELALSLGDDEEERQNLLSRGWRIRNADEVSSTLDGYRDYVRQSRGEFSCAKPSYVRLQTAWISDRTLCYLASGKPVVVQHTGPSRFLPDASGIFRFRTPEEARRHLDSVMGSYDEQCVNARALAEEYFDARKVAESLYERAV